MSPKMYKPQVGTFLQVGWLFILYVLSSFDNPERHLPCTEYGCTTGIALPAEKGLAYHFGDPANAAARDPL